MAAPLTPEHKAQIDDYLLKLKEAREIVARAKLAGFDVAAQEARIGELEGQLKSIRQAFFPTGR